MEENKLPTKKCKHCQESIDIKAKRCPKCGGNLGMPGWAKALIIVGVVFVCMIGCVGGCAGILGGAVSEAAKETFGGYDDQNGNKSFKVGESFESKYLKITFDSSNLNFTNYSEYATVADGYKVVEFKFTAENIGDENQNFSYTDFDCYADDQTMQQFYSVDGAGMDSGGTLSKGKKATVPVYCEVPTNASKVSVEFKPILADNNYEFVAE